MLLRCVRALAAPERLIAAGDDGKVQHLNYDVHYILLYMKSCLKLIKRNINTGMID